MEIIDQKEPENEKEKEEEEKKEENNDSKQENNKNEINNVNEVSEDEKNIINDKKEENENLFEDNSDEQDEPEYSKNDIEALYLRTKTNKTMKIEQFYEQKRHYFIMTEGGTPIYSRYGDEIKNCSLLATFSAIITKFTIFNNEQNSQEKLNYICNENSIIAFLKKGKIVYIALSNKTDSISFLYSQLELYVII